MTNSQKEEIKILVRLGDSLELATKTVLNEKIIDTAIYKRAYES
jgi:hypothetical protein